MPVKPFFSRIGKWLRGDGDETLLPLEKQAQRSEIVPIQPARSTFLRPWARRDAAIASLQQGFETLAGLVNAIRESLEKQGRRQDEMITYLSHLPELLATLPDAQRQHGETLKLLAQQLQKQVENGERLEEILGRINLSQNDERTLLDALNQRYESLQGHSDAISENLRQASSSLENAQRHSESGTQVLQQMHERMGVRDQHMERIIRRQAARFTILLVVAIVLSIAALVSVSVIGLMILRRPH